MTGKPKRRKRFVRIDVEFFHKRTCDQLLVQLGPWGPLAFLSLLAASKRSTIPGHVVIASEAEFWQQLGLYGHDIPFDMSTFLELTGRLKQTSRTPFGRLTDVSLTHFSEWQRDWRKEDDTDRKSASRQAQSRPDNNADTMRTESVTDLDVDLPTEEDLRAEVVTDPSPKTWRCTLEGHDNLYTWTGPHAASRLESHLINLHELEGQELAAAIEKGTPT